MLKGRVRKKGKLVGWPKVRRILFILSFVVVPLVHFAVFYLYVNFDSFFMAFCNVENGEVKFVGLNNFTWIFEMFRKSRELADVLPATENLLIATRNTFITFGIRMILFPVGMFVSYFIYKKIFCAGFFRVVFYLPAIVSSVVISFFYVQLNDPGTFFSGWIGKMVGLSGEALERFAPLYDSRYANFVVLLEVIWLGIPSNLILWGGAFARIPDSVIESARLDGVNWVQEMFRIILPCVWPTFVLLVITSLAGVFGATGNVFLLTDKGKYNTQTLSNWLYCKVLSVTNNPTSASTLYYVSALGMMMTVISCGIAVLVRFVLTRKVEEVEY